MKSSETGGPCTKNSSQRRPTLPAEARVGFPGSHFLCVGNELIEAFSPSVVEAHLLVSFAAFFVPVHGESGIFRPASSRLERDDRRKGEQRRAARSTDDSQAQGNRPNELLVFDDFEIAADVREFLSFGRTA